MWRQQPCNKGRLAHQMPTNIDGIIALLLAIVPGHVTNVIWSRAKTRQAPRGDLYTVLQALTLSVIIQICAAPLTALLIYPARHDLLDIPLGALFLWLLATLVILPGIVGTGLGHFEDQYLAWTRPQGATGHGLVGRRLAALAVRIRPSPAPSAWDRLFTRGILPGSWIVVEFNDGSTVAGAWEEGSGATTSPEPHGLILAEEWVLDADGNLAYPVEQTGGVLIPTDANIRKIRVLKQESGESADERSQDITNDTAIS